jgi:competence/damage-inducible protein CinA-like protein
MHAEIIAIGSELTSGQNLDTNSQWLSQRLASLGIPVLYHTTVADHLTANVGVFTAASRRADLVIATGGLGPTQDDLTRDALAQAGGVELVFHPELLDAIATMFRERGREMPERNRVQAYLPAGAEVIPNAGGTAPGIWMRLGSAWVAALPGVPREMMQMYEQSIRPRLEKLGFGRGVTVIRKINTFGAGESAVEAKLLDLTRRGRIPEVGITASDAVISLRIIAHAATEAEARALIAPTEAAIRERLGDLVFGTDDEELEHVVLRLLDERKMTIVTAESLTAGLVAQKLGRVPGASASLLGGVVAYANEVKRDVLGVSDTLLKEHGAVSGPVVEAMAAGARKLMGSDLAISTSGIAGPTGATATKPVGLVYFGLAWAGGVVSTHVQWFGSREEVQSRAAKSALNMARLHLLKKKVD